MKFRFLFFYVLVATTIYAQPAEPDYQGLIARETQQMILKQGFRANPNTQNYDVRYHKIELTVDPAIRWVDGKVTTRFVPVDAPMQQVIFDLNVDMVVATVTQNNVTLPFLQSNNQLVITLPTAAPAGIVQEVVIKYAGAPPVGGESFATTTHNSVPIMWTLSEPFGAMDWWPCKQDLTDKIESLDFYITAPANYVSAANGLEQSKVTNVNNTATTHFHHSYPIPAYLVAFAVSNYRVFTQQAGTAPNTFPIVNYLYPEGYDANVTRIARTLPIMNLFESLFGTYPFQREKYGHAQFGWGGGMEHTTVSFMGDFSRSLIAHELAHHWFGNKVTCASWNDVWLNEGFAEYLSGLVYESLDGPNSFGLWKRTKVNSITRSTSGNLYLTDAQALDAGRIFDGRITYDKGSMVVHMLRKRLGDEVFFQGMRNYLSDPELAYGSATTPQLKQHLEQASNRDLTAFFNAWVYGQGYPIYHAEVSAANDHSIVVNLSQTTTHGSVPFFEMPVKIKCVDSNQQEQFFVLENTINNQSFVLDLNIGTPVEVIVDPDSDIVSRGNTVTLSAKEFKLDPTAIYIAPNPTKDNLHIHIKDGTVFNNVELFSIQGKFLFQTDKSVIDVSKLDKGTYLAVVNTLEGVFHKKFIKN